MEDETIIIPVEDLRKNNYKVRLDMFFGGKLSPMKTSKYELNLHNPSLGIQSDNILYIHENIILSEIQERLGLSKEDQLKKILGR